MLQSKWDFDVKQNYLVGKSDAISSNWILAPRLKPGFRSGGIDLQVDFSHRYHQVSLKYEACFPLETDEYYQERVSEILKQNRKTALQIKRKDFQLKVKCFRKGDDRVKIAQDHLSCANHPYTNPKPHDFRPDNIVLLENKPRMRFLTAPDSGKMVLNKQFRPSSARASLPNTRVSNGTGIVTQVTQQTKYCKDLYFNKGRYSPAFTAHNAYLDRILKNITDRLI